MLGVALRLGLTSFGGPVAHIGYFRHEYVERRRWVDEQAFSELVATPAAAAKLDVVVRVCMKARVAELSFGR